MSFWLENIESFEALCQDEDARRLVLRMAEMSHTGRLAPFLTDVALADELDDETRENVAELARDASFLLAVEDYVRRTHRLH